MFPFNEKLFSKLNWKSLNCSLPGQLLQHLSALFNVTQQDDKDMEMKTQSSSQLLNTRGENAVFRPKQGNRLFLPA